MRPASNGGWKHDRRNTLSGQMVTRAVVGGQGKCGRHKIIPLPESRCVSLPWALFAS
jgi:hypothetical protein